MGFLCPTRLWDFLAIHEPCNGSASSQLLACKSPENPQNPRNSPTFVTFSPTPRRATFSNFRRCIAIIPNRQSSSSSPRTPAAASGAGFGGAQPPSNRFTPSRGMVHRLIVYAKASAVGQTACEPRPPPGKRRMAAKLRL